MSGFEYIFCMYVLFQAKIFGQAIMISPVHVRVDNEASAELEKLAT